MLDKIFDRASGVFQSAQESVATKSALNPLLWLNAIWLFFVFLMVGLSWWNDRDDFILPLLYSVLVLLGADLLAFFYLLFFAPNRLQSETYNIERKRLQMIGDHIRGLGPEVVLPVLPVQSDGPTSNNYIERITERVQVSDAVDAEVRRG